MDERRGLYIPAEIWSLDSLTIAERIVLSEIAFLDSQGRCFANNNHFGRLLGCSASNARKIIYSLLDAGVVVRVSASGHGERVLCPNLAAAHVQTWTPPCPNPDTVKDKTESKPKTQKRTPTRPNLDMVREWFRKNNAPTMAEPFFDFYDANGWVQGKGKPIRNWEAAARGWIRRQNQWNNENKQRGFDRLKFSADNIRAWADGKNNPGNDGGPSHGDNRT